MTKRQAIPTAPEPLEAYARHFDSLFGKSNQRDEFRRYLEGLLLPTERNKTLTGLANTEPAVGAQHPRAQGMQWFLSESNWQERQLQERRLHLLLEEASTAPNSQGVLVIDEHGDRKRGHKTAHIGKQYLANVGKIDTGVVSVTSLWADEGVYYPVDFEPYTPADYFAEGKQAGLFRTKLKIGVELVRRAVQVPLPFRAVVADSFYGEDRGFRQGLRDLHVGYVLALKPSHAWYHPEAEIGSFQEAAQEAGWEGAERPGHWIKVPRTFRDGSSQDWWALELDIRPFGPDKSERVVIATTDPVTLPDLSTFYLITNLPVPGSSRAQESEFAAASVEEVVRLYGLRMWVEESYKQVKHALGWSEYQVRSDQAIRRHWQLVCCAFSFCWYHQAHLPATVPLEPAQPPSTAKPEQDKASGEHKARKKKGGRKVGAATSVLAQSAAGGSRVARTLGLTPTVLACVVSTSPTTPAPAAP
ncbi:MAG TPA: IS701 family transposase [Ktedonobacteraceae bacterium]|nr:IS701 family transposase [Ktedonobacteraceae bacterium]